MVTKIILFNYSTCVDQESSFTVDSIHQTTHSVVCGVSLYLDMTDIIQNEFQNEWWEFWKDMNVCLMVTRALHLVTKTIRIYIYHLQGYFCCPCVTCQTGKKLGE